MIQTASDRAFLLMLISVCLGACFIRAFWEIEQGRRRRQARRVLRQYEHLSQTNSNRIPENENGRCEQGGSSRIDGTVSGAR
jgi:hypothetical protein